jgi:hypothetical protein
MVEFRNYRIESPQIPLRTGDKFSTQGDKNYRDFMARALTRIMHGSIPLL